MKSEQSMKSPINFHSVIFPIFEAIILSFSIPFQPYYIEYVLAQANPSSQRVITHSMIAFGCFVFLKLLTDFTISRRSSPTPFIVKIPTLSFLLAISFVLYGTLSSASVYWIFAGKMLLGSCYSLTRVSHLNQPPSFHPFFLSFIYLVLFGVLSLFSGGSYDPSSHSNVFDGWFDDHPASFVSLLFASLSLILPMLLNLILPSYSDHSRSRRMGGSTYLGDVQSPNSESNTDYVEFEDDFSTSSSSSSQRFSLALSSIQLLEDEEISGLLPVTQQDILPERFLRGCKGDEEEAWRRWNETVDWRRRENVDKILIEIQPVFHLIKVSHIIFMIISFHKIFDFLGFLPPLCS